MSVEQVNDSNDDLQSPPFCFAGGVANLRDLGGYRVSPTTSLRRNFIYRSAHLSRLTDSGARTLSHDLGIKTIYDLRSIGEACRSPSCDVPEAIRLHVPVFRDQDASPESLALRYKDYSSSEGPRGFMRAYTEILKSGAANGAYKTVFEHIRDRPTEPLLIHCTAGKDRTGVLAALILGVAGVDQEEIGREYELTEVGLGELKHEFIRRLLNHPVLKDDPEGVHRMVSSKAPAIQATLHALDSEYGSVEEYLKTTMGFNNEDIQKIKKNLVVEEKAIL